MITQIKEWLDVCFGMKGMDWKSHVKFNPDFVSEYKTLVSNPSRMKGLGWKPEVTFEQLAKMMMDTKHS
ncbi:MAG: hypothetical protein QM734_01270 [Cyclobacteriaceae bacterium]